jgi:hypothetical protein
MAPSHGKTPTEEWVTFPGGELEGKRPKALCDACRNVLKTAAFRRTRRPEPRRPLCFQCYRAGLERDRALRTAGEIDTATAARFQFQLPFEAVNRPRLERLRADRVSARTGLAPGSLDRRRAQIDARRMLQQVAAGLRSRGLASDPASRARAIFQAVHAAELQLPESWLPFVLSR